MSALMLRPCPFCGKEAKTYHAFPEFEHGWTIDCDHDDECILRVAHGMFACEETEERAADTWNRRADMPPGYLILSPDEMRGMERDRQAVEFAARWCWRTDPPHASGKLTDAERLSAIKYHPTIKKYGQPHIELAERENSLKGGRDDR